MKVLKIIVPVLFCFALGFIASQVQGTSIVEWYPSLQKSPHTPPNEVFGIAWSGNGYFNRSGSNS